MRHDKGCWLQIVGLVFCRVLYMSLTDGPLFGITLLHNEKHTPRCTCVNCVLCSCFLLCLRERRHESTPTFPEQRGSMRTWTLETNFVTGAPTILYSIPPLRVLRVKLPAKIARCCCSGSECSSCSSRAHLLLIVCGQSMGCCCNHAGRLVPRH